MDCFHEHKITKDEKIDIDMFAYALTEDFTQEMSEHARNYVVDVYLKIRDSPPKQAYLPAALGEALKCCADVELALFRFRKNYYMLERERLFQ
ncbi:MAG: hypothetical protein NTY20_01305 [Candidatus Aenigmarchaeota archaeon]|nr:hypothetical protein [Candidatus Aenigmarchaeota archaeon]